MAVSCFHRERKRPAAAEEDGLIWQWHPIASLTGNVDADMNGKLALAFCRGN
jgi:hypothetical protein